MNTESPTTINRWIMDPDAPSDFLLKPCLERLKIMVEDGLESHPGYVWTLVEICLCYIALGHVEDATRYREMILPQLPRWPDPTKISHYWVVEEIKRHPDVTKHPWWLSWYNKNL